MSTKLEWEIQIINGQKHGSAHAHGFYYAIQNDKVTSIFSAGNNFCSTRLMGSFEFAQDSCQSHHDAICAAIEEAKPKWIAVADRLPEERKLVNVAYPDGSVLIDSWFKWETMENPMWFRDADGNRTPTHWGPLPEAPKPEESK